MHRVAMCATNRACGAPRVDPRGRCAALAALAAAAWLAPSIAAGEPLPLSRPRDVMMWEPVAPATATSQVNTHTIYLHRCVDSDCAVVQGTTNSTTDPVHSSLGHGVLSPFSRSNDVWNTVVACMHDVYAPFNVEITELDP